MPRAGAAKGAETEVAEISRWGSPVAPRLLIEVPHGATARADFEALRARLHGDLPAGIEAFFHVNTDEGAPELARAVAARLARRRLGTLIVRCRLPRTLVDTNRVVTGAIEPGMTAGIPSYVRDAADRDLLLGLHARYGALAAAAGAEVCGAGGLALALHSYAPRSVEVEVDGDVVAALADAYRPETVERWPLRPEVDLVTRTPEGDDLAPAGLTADLRRELEAAGFEVGASATYPLHPATSAYRQARRWPGRVLCVEVRRDLLGGPWVPFAESRIDPAAVGRIADPLAAALARHLGA